MSSTDQADQEYATLAAKHPKTHEEQMRFRKLYDALLEQLARDQQAPPKPVTPQDAARLERQRRYDEFVEQNRPAKPTPPKPTLDELDLKINAARQSWLQSCSDSEAAAKDVADAKRVLKAAEARVINCAHMIRHYEDHCRRLETERSRLFHEQLGETQ